MNGRRKSLGVLLLLIVLSVAIASTVFADGTVAYTGTVAEAEELLLTSVNAQTAEAKCEALDTLLDYLTEKPIKNDAEGYASFLNKLYNERLECAKLLLANVDITLGTAKNGIAVRKLNAFVKAHEIPADTNGHSEFKTEMDAKVKAQNDAMAEQREALEAKAQLSDYQYAPYYNANFDTAGNVGGLTAQKNVEGGKTLTFIGQESGKDGDNGYYTVTYDLANYHFRTTAELGGAVDSLVFECDFTTFGTLPNNGVGFDNGSYSDTIDGSSISPRYFTITAEGDIYDSVSKKTFLAGAVVKGEWLHISMIIDVDTGLGDVYADYEYIGTVNTANNSKGITYNPMRFRIGGNPSEAGSEFSLDNVVIYRGDSLRDLTLFENMTPENKAVYYAGVLTNGGANALSKETAYIELGALVGQFYNPVTGKFSTNDKQVQGAVNTYLGFDISAVEKIIADDNLAVYVQMCDGLFGIERRPDTLTMRTGQVAAIENYLGQIKGRITVNDKYLEYNEKMNDVRQKITYENNINAFNIVMMGFENAAKINDMQKYYDEAKAYEKLVDKELLGDPNYSTFISAYELFLRAEGMIKDAIYIDNSRKIILAIESILRYDTLDWDAKYDEINPFVVNARSLIRAAEYDAYYEGLDYYLAEFSYVNEYFYEKLQLRHIAHFEAELKKADESTGYFEQYGICMTLKRYLEKEDVDLERTEIVTLVNKLDAKITKLVADRPAYDAMLEENTVKFIDTCKTLVGNISYKETKAILEVASSYYDAMNVDSADAKNSIILYDLRTAEIQRAESIAADLIMNVNMLKVAATEENFLALAIVVADILPTVETEVDGVKEAIESFKDECAKFNASLTDVNNEIAITVDMAVSFANDDGRETFIHKVLDEIKD